MANNAANLRGYLLVTACYWAFTISDGALRMLVLLHLHAEGQTAIALALLLVPYELAGVVTNLLSGFLGARRYTCNSRPGLHVQFAMWKLEYFRSYAQRYL